VTTKVLLRNHFWCFPEGNYKNSKPRVSVFTKLIYVSIHSGAYMAKQVSLSNEVVKELNMLRGEESYSQIIKRLLANQPKTDNERIYEAFEPFMEAICKMIDQEMRHPIELFRVICVKLASKKYKYKEDVNKLVEALGEYLEELK